MERLRRHGWWADGVVWCGVGVAALLLSGLLLLATMAGFAVAVTGAGSSAHLEAWVVAGLAGLGFGMVALLGGAVLAWRQHRAGEPVTQRFRQLVAWVLAAVVVIVLLGTSAWWLLPAIGVLCILLRQSRQR